MLMSIGPVLVIGGRVDWSCMQAGIGLEGCCRTIAACGHIRERSADYFQELDEATVKVHPEERQVSDFVGSWANITWMKGLL